MILAAILMAAVQTGSDLPPPVVIQDNTQTMPVRAISWTCRATASDGKPISVSGDFPALTQEQLKTGAGYRLHSSMRGTGIDGFNGSFPATLTFNLLGMTNYSILVGSLDSGSQAYILKFEFYEGAHSGFVNVLSAGGKTLTAYAAGLCTSQVKS